jgi:hypothetical protein
MGLGMAWLGNARHDLESQGMAWKCKAWNGNARHDLARQGNAWHKHSYLTTKTSHKIKEYHNNHNMKPTFQSLINLKYLFNCSFYIPRPSRSLLILMVSINLLCSQ